MRDDVQVCLILTCASSVYIKITYPAKKTPTGGNLLGYGDSSPCISVVP